MPCRKSEQANGVATAVVVEEQEEVVRKRTLVWAAGITTCSQRRNDLLPRTLESLRKAGFEELRLFVDGARDPVEWERQFNCLVTSRWPTIRTYGNWILALAELYIRRPDAERYAIFQDDFVTYPNLKEYLEQTPYPDGDHRHYNGVKGYQNLYTFPQNEDLTPTDLTVRREKKVGWFESNQMGRGAVALVFNREAVLTLLTHPHMIERPMDAHRGWKAVDGGVVTALKKAGYKEFCHYPSLIQHTGLRSSMGNKPHPLSQTFRGEEFDAKELLREREG